MPRLLIFVLLLITSFLQAQELNATVTFSTSQVAATNQQVFKTLQKSVAEFLNTTKWSDKIVKNKEKIDCSFFFTINSVAADQFTATLQVQASRPVFNSTYSTSILNVNDKEVSFGYTEYQKLFFDVNSYESNLVSILAFYANIIIGVDEDTFAIEGGSKSLEIVQNIVNVAQQSQASGWSQSSGNQNRYYLINDMLSPTYAAFRKTMYTYHFLGLDKMADDQKAGKEGISSAIKTLTEVAIVRPNAYLTRVFFDAKTDEIVSVFTDGPKIEIADVIQNLNRLSPTNSSKWGQISY